VGLGREISPFADLAVLWRLRKLVMEFRPHIVHTHTAKAGFLGRVAARWCRVPVVIHTFHGHVLRGYFGPLRTWLFRSLERALAGVTDALIAVSEGVARDLVLLGVAPRERFRVLPLGLRLEALTQPLPRGRLRSEAAFPRDAPVVGIVGRLVPIKDVPCLLEAATIVRKSRPDIYFSVIGDGQERSLLKSTAARLGLVPGGLHFHGWHKDLKAVYGDLDLVVNCSINEGTPVALIEAMAAGCPVVATAVGGNPDLLGEGRFGALVPPRDPPALARAIMEALGDGRPEALQRTDEARRHVLRNYSADRLVADVDALYRELLHSRGVAV
jgi:glycosyltransferase involved in cell wall biosynthesis